MNYICGMWAKTEFFTKILRDSRIIGKKPGFRAFLVRHRPIDLTQAQPGEKILAGEEF